MKKLMSRRTNRKMSRRINKVRVLFGGLAVMLLITSAAPVMTYAAEMDYAVQEEVDMSVEEVDEPEYVEEDSYEPEYVEEDSCEQEYGEEDTYEPEYIEEDSCEPDYIEEDSCEAEYVEEDSYEAEDVEEDAYEAEDVEEDVNEAEDAEEDTDEADDVEAPEQDEADDVETDKEADATDAVAREEETKYEKGLVISDERIAEGEENKATDNNTVKQVFDIICDSLFDDADSFVPYSQPFLKMLKGFVDLMCGESASSEYNELMESQEKHFSELNKKIDDLKSDVKKYSTLLDNRIVNQSEKTTLGEYFRVMNRNAKDLSRSMNSILAADYTPEQKRVLLADLNNGDYLVKLRQAVDDIDEYTMSEDGIFNISFFQTIMDSSADGKMFKSEAYEESRKATNVLLEQYMNANALLLQCQSAANALEFTPEQKEAMFQNKEVKKAYKRSTLKKDELFKEDALKDTYYRFSNCIEAYKRYEDNKYTGNLFINKKTTSPVVLEFDDALYKNANSNNFKKMYANQYFNKEDMAEFIDNIKTAKDEGESIYDYLKKNYQAFDFATFANNDENKDEYTRHRYIVIDPEITTTTTRNKDKDYRVRCRTGKYSKGYSTIHVSDVEKTIKVVDIYDPDCKVQNLLVESYEINDIGTSKNTKEYTHNYVKIGAHQLKDTDRLSENDKGELVAKNKAKIGIELLKDKVQKILIDIKGPKK